MYGRQGPSWQICDVEAAGTRGSAVLQFGTQMPPTETSAISTSKLGPQGLEIVAAPTTAQGTKPMKVTCALTEALEIELGLDPRIDTSMKFATTALALVQCVFDPSNLRVHADAINGRTLSGLAESCVENRNDVDEREWLQHLGALLGSKPFSLRDTRSILAFSVGSNSVYYRAILDNECFDLSGRVLAISPGRIGLNRLLRSIVTGESPSQRAFSQSHPAATINSYLPGLELRPRHAQGAVKVCFECCVGGNEIRISCFLGVGDQPLSSETTSIAWDLWRFDQSDLATTHRTVLPPRT
ncbi:MAG: hypothetical protein MMC33_007851 [Icmadophila ericetorum]|nr:hypothetical protein [Icmadophila ericetorum]